MNVGGATLLGILPATVEHPWEYFAVRGTFLDCRGPLSISAGSFWGFRVMVLTRGHSIRGLVANIGPSVNRPVVVESGAWIASGALLYNCVIRRNSVVAAGSVVRSCEVGPDVIVAGDPARVVARWTGTEWDWSGERWGVLR